MKKKTIIVTGASTGIGKAIAKLFIDKGHNVIMNSSNRSNLEKAFQEFGSPSNVKIVVGDISEKTLGDVLVDTAIHQPAQNRQQIPGALFHYHFWNCHAVYVHLGILDV